MSTLTFDGTAAASNEAAQRGKADTLRVAALALLSIRFIQGLVYGGGGSHRFIYAPAKLNPNAANWMANKFQSAMPGALLATDHIIALWRFSGSMAPPRWSYAPSTAIHSTSPSGR